MLKVIHRNGKKRRNYAVDAADTKRARRVAADPLQILPAGDEQSALDVVRDLRDVPPSHYLFKIKNFSHISNATADNFESNEFEVGGYKWNLSLYPKGNKKVGEKEHISLYLVLVNSKEFSFQREVNVCLKLFVYNQILDKFLAVQDARGRVSRFRGMKRECGFHKLIPLSVFNDASNGYLVNDCCIFGAEIFVLGGSSKGEHVNIVKELGVNSHAWEINKFHKLDGGIYFSDDFDIGGYKWSLELHPEGHEDLKNNSIAAYLCLDDAEDFGPGHSLYVEYVLRMRDQINGNHFERSDRRHFSLATSGCWGFGDFMPLSKFNDPSLGFRANGSMILEVQILQISKVKVFS